MFANRSYLLKLIWLVMLIFPVVIYGESPYLKHEISYKNEPFKTGSSSYTPDWVKFTILLNDPTTVYFQDSNHYTYHYTFAVTELPEFAGFSPENFDLATLYETGQQAVLGAVLFPTDYMEYEGQTPEIGIQFVRHDAYDPADIITYFNLVRSKVIHDSLLPAFYMPAYEQLESAQANQDILEAGGVIVSSVERWTIDNSCYNNGWALGELKYIPADEIDLAYTLGTLNSSDILLTDALPSEIPFVAGVVTLSPATPNSHVVTLANTWNIPVAYLAEDEIRNTAFNLLGNLVVLRVEGNSFSDYPDCHVSFIDADGKLSDQHTSEILALKIPPPLDILPMLQYGSYTLKVDDLPSSFSSNWTDSPLQYVGGKASGYKVLRLSVSQNTRVAAALTFDLWNDFLDQTISEGKTLREEINTLLGQYTWPPEDVAAIQVDLSYIQEMFKNTSYTQFTPVMRSEILTMLQDPELDFNPNQKIRFRSSSNLEDGVKFTGAGLYDSYSGCLADELDGDDLGPSACDPSDSNERGVFRAIRRVYASFYNLNAFLERLRHGISEDEVGMAVLVHHSFADETELANGVGTYYTSRDGQILLNSQTGAVSVANPDPNILPEIARLLKSHSSGEWSVEYWDQVSNLVILGEKVLDYPDDYPAVAELMEAASNAWYQYDLSFIETPPLEIEFKKLKPDGKLILKQIRPVASPFSDDTQITPPFLINEPVEQCLCMGEIGGNADRSVFGYHRLKSQWHFESITGWLDEEARNHSPYINVRVELADDGTTHIMTGGFSGWQKYTYTYVKRSDPYYNPDAAYTWDFDQLEYTRHYEMTKSMPRDEVGISWAIFSTKDFADAEMRVSYDFLQRSWGSDSDWTMIDNAYLCECPRSQPGEIYRDITFADNGTTIKSKFYFPPYPTGIVAGYTAPLERWEETIIKGLTSEPIILHGWYSQTYAPYHHNFEADFLFEPQLEPSISPKILQELKSKNIRYILVGFDFDIYQYVIRTYGFEPVTPWNIWMLK